MPDDDAAIHLWETQVKIEDAGFDWKILGPDVQDKEYVAYVCDQDAYSYRCAHGLMPPSLCRRWLEIPLAVVLFSCVVRHLGWLHSTEIVTVFFHYLCKSSLTNEIDTRHSPRSLVCSLLECIHRKKILGPSTSLGCVSVCK